MQSEFQPASANVAADDDNTSTMAPICLVAFRRPAHTQAVLQALADCPEASESVLHVFIDGPRNPEERVQVKAVAERCRSATGFRQIMVREREQNLGMAQSVMQAVDAVLATHPYAIVIEDDVVPTRDFLTFMNTSLRRWHDTAQVMAISGYVFDDVSATVGNSAFFSRRGACWGWGVWQRSWTRLDRDRVRLIRRIEQSDVQAFLEPAGCMSMTRKLRDAVEGRDNSWSPMWFASCALDHGLFLYPPRPLTKNIGFDGSGEHGLHSDAYTSRTASTSCSPEQPPHAVEHPEAEAMFLAHYRAAWASRSR